MTTSYALGFFMTGSECPLCPIKDHSLEVERVDRDEDTLQSDPLWNTQCLSDGFLTGPSVTVCFTVEELILPRLAGVLLIMSVPLPTSRNPLEPVFNPSGLGVKTDVPIETEKPLVTTRHLKSYAEMQLAKTNRAEGERP
jgi:hypothetical protein